jgi:hypothetical protein
VHVCQRWRNIIFASPRQLELYLTCTQRTSVKKNLGFWPVTLPLSLDYSFFLCRTTPEDEDNVVAALDYPSRIHSIGIYGAEAPLMKRVVTAMRKPFPSLTNLDLTCQSPHPIPVIPRKFLGGSVPHLQHLRLEYISYPHLPTLLLSARNLVTLILNHIPLNGYIPEGMAGILATLTGLRTFSISCYDTSPSDQWQSRPDPPMRSILPALTYFSYNGHSRYLEDFLAQVDMPRVDHVRIEYPMHQIRASQLSRFIERTENFKIDQLTRAEVVIYDEDPFFALGRPKGKFDQARLIVQIFDEAHLEIQVQRVVHVLRQLAPMFFNVDVLYVRGYYVQRQSSEMNITDWLPLFCTFPAVEVLRLSGGPGVYIASALEDTTADMVTEVLPLLHLIRLVKDPLDNEDEEVDWDFWNESTASMDRFLLLRQFSGCPVTVLSMEDEVVEADWRP